MINKYLVLFISTTVVVLFQSICECTSSPQGWDATIRTLATLTERKTNRLRALVVYHLGPLREKENSMDIMKNNVKLFAGSIRQSEAGVAPADFYIFNVIGEPHPLLHLIPEHLPNVGLVKWNATNSDLAAHLLTLDMLTTERVDKFEAVLFLNHGVRGPLVHRRNGEWIEAFMNPLRSNNVAMVGPTLSCEVSPHVQTHMFALRAALIPLVQEKMKQRLEAKYKSWKDLIASLEVGLTGLIISAGYNVSSFMHQSRGQPYYTSCLKYDGPQNLVDKNPTSWCGLSPQTLVFVKWGGEAMRNPGYMCNSMVRQMDDALEQTARAEPHLQLTVPEVRRGGPMSNVFKMYAQEAWIDRRPVLPVRTTTAREESVQKVCFLVRVIAPRLAHFTYENPMTDLINKELVLLITTLRRQSNPNWLAMIYRIDNKPTHGEINQMVRSFNDSRLEYGPFAREGGLKYTTTDAGYAGTDKFLQRALQRPECQWISVTTSDNAYGSEVVKRVLSYQAGASMLAVPLDSKRYFDRLQLNAARQSKRPPRQLASTETTEPVSRRIARAPHQRTKKSKNRPSAHKSAQSTLPLNSTTEPSLGCTLLPRLAHTGVTHVVRATPSSLRMDLGGVFFRREKLAQENIFFGNFSDRSKFPCVDTAEDSTDPPGYLCLNAQGAHLLHHLSSPSSTSSSSLRHSSRWTLARLPVDGLKSVVFHGNSPTLCIGADHIWFDHADRLRQRCVTTLDAFRMMEKPEHVAAYDFDHLWKKQGPVIGSCLRMRRGY